MSKSGPENKNEDEAQLNAPQFTPLMRTARKTYTREQLRALSNRATPITQSIENTLKALNIYKY